jgi:DNA repair protein RadD
MKIELRPYQKEAIETVLEKLNTKSAVLLQAATGSGKSLISAGLIQRLVTNYPGTRLAFIAHRQELIAQNYDKLMRYWPGGFFHTGQACASIGKVNVDKPVVIGSIQTMSNRNLKVFDLLIIDEVHHVAPMEDNDQYISMIKAQKELNPNLRILGLTATPFRLGHGYIYGDHCRKGKTNLFTELDYSITMNKLIEAGYLAPWRAKQPGGNRLDLSGLRIERGDYHQGELSDFMSRTVHLQSTLDAWEKYGEGRKNVLVFAVTIRHAERLERVFLEAGHRAAAVHSEMDNQKRRGILAAFEKGELDFLINVGILTEGWDSPRVDQIIMCRPTKSPGLFVQMIGRGSRLCEGKKDVLILDLADNFYRHGDPSSPFVNVRFGDETGEAPVKICPECSSVIFLGTKICPYCGTEIKVEIKELAESPALVDVTFDKFYVSDISLENHTSAKGNNIIKMYIRFVNHKPILIFMGFDPEQKSSFFKIKSNRIWRYLANRRLPRTSAEAVTRQREIVLPKTLTPHQKNGFWDVKEFN